MGLFYLATNTWALHLICKCMSMNISDKTMSLIVQNYRTSLVLVAKAFIGDTTISVFKKRGNLKLGVLIAAVSEWILSYLNGANSLHKILFLPMKRKCLAFLTNQKSCDPLATTAVRYGIDSNFSRVFHSSLIFMWICFCIVKVTMRYLSVTLCCDYFMCSALVNIRTGCLN